MIIAAFSTPSHQALFDRFRRGRPEGFNIFGMTDTSFGEHDALLRGPECGMLRGRTRKEQKDVADRIA